MRGPSWAGRWTLLVAFAVVLPMVGAVPAQAAPADSPLVSAHRGGAAYAPENTMVAFRNAVRLGADQLEADTQLTGDGELVVIHDDTLDRTTDCSGVVADTTLADIRACDAAHWFSPGQPTTEPDETLEHPLRRRGITVPTTSELLAYASSLGPDGPELSIEIKDIPGEANFDPAGTEAAEVLVPLIEAHGVADRVVVQSFWPAAIDAVKRLAPHIRTQFLTTSSTGQTAGQNLTYVTTRGHDVVAPNHDAPDLNAELVTAAHEAGKQVVPWTPDTVDDLTVTVDLGVDGIITNHPACLLQLLDRPVPARVLAPGVPGDLPACANGLVSIDADRPDPATCKALRPSRWRAATGRPVRGAALRTVALQFKQHVRYVETYDTFRTKMRCLMEEHVVPVMRRGLPTLVVYNEDIGLMTLATGSRGAAVREMATSPARAPVGDQGPAPIAAAAALAETNAAYAPQIAEYQRRFGPIDPRKQAFIGATDTMVRAYTQTFSDIARDYGVHVVATNNMAEYEASSDPLDIALFRDPDLDEVDEVYVATSPTVTNQTAIWGPGDVDPDGPPGERNLLFKNHKVPITSLEADLLAIDEGPATGPDALANAAGVEVEGFRLGFATSLPAFQWGYPFGERPADLDPCADVRDTYMPCMDELGVDVVIQAEANPGRWAGYVPGGWQPLEWMESTWRSVADPTVDFRYNVTAHMVGNLLDVTFDGQTAITSRGHDGDGLHYVGNTRIDPERDVDGYRVYVGDKREFVELAPWVVADTDRDELAEVASQLAPGSGHDRENDYLETAVWADLTHAGRRGGRAAPHASLPVTGGGPGATALLLLAATPLIARRRDPW